MDADLDDLAASVAAVAGRSPWAFSDDELTSRIRRVHELASRLTAVSATLVREADGRAIARRNESPSTTHWVRRLVRVSAREARTLLTLGRVIDSRPALAGAIASGSVNNSQALAIGRVLEDVPDDDPATVDKVESMLVDLAAEHEPTVLQQLGERVLAHVNPELADAKLRDKLERDERDAHRRRGFTLSADGRGGTRLSGILDPEGAAVVAAAIEPLNALVRGESGPDLRRPAARRADSLVEVCRLALRTEELPTSGGLPAQVNVTVDYNALARDVAVGQLDTGSRLAPSAVRRFACEAGILPAVLDSAGVPIDVGRARRPYTGAARTAVALRDGGCAFPGCDRPIRWCHIHHVTPWSVGGATDRTTASRCAATTIASCTTAIGKCAWAPTGAPNSSRQRTSIPINGRDETRTTSATSCRLAGFTRELRPARSTRPPITARRTAAPPGPASPGLAPLWRDATPTCAPAFPHAWH